jgi:hypothetical protein
MKVVLCAAALAVVGLLSPSSTFAESPVMLPMPPLTASGAKAITLAMPP